MTTTQMPLAYADVCDAHEHVRTNVQDVLTDTTLGSTSENTVLDSYQRPRTRKSPKTPWQEWFWTKVDKNGPIPVRRPDLGPCWIWAAGRSTRVDKTKPPYGTYSIPGSQRRSYAHRLAYELVNGSIPEGYEVDHLCVVTLCVNPGHLEAVTRRENNLRSSSRSAMQARQTHCIRGHEFDAENTYRTPKGERRCRICMRAQHRLKRLRRRNRGPVA